MADMKRFLSFAVSISMMMVCLVSGSFAQTSEYPDITGTWVGSYVAGFAKTNPVFPDGTVETNVELEIYRQQDNLLWVINRWRRTTETQWVEEYAVGSFLAGEDDELIINEIGGNKSPIAHPGFFFGELDDGRLYVTYAGDPHGVAFNAVLERQRN